MTPVRVGLLGCGTVGGGVVQLLRENAAEIAAVVGAPLELTRVLVSDPRKPRVPELDAAKITTHVEDVFGAGAPHVVVEVMGGVEPARGYVLRAMAAGMSVVTANKMLLATHGPELVEGALAAGVDLAFEAAVGGGIPIIRVLREALAGDRVRSVVGIVNGTCNFILSRMQRDGASFEAALSEAQTKGYAEADPGLDVDGHDAAHKLVVLAMLAFGAKVKHVRVPTEGIRHIEPVDHRFAERFGHVVKHLAIGRELASGELDLRVHPTLVPRDATLANVNDVLNALAVEGRALGPCLLSGRGAGAMPTAVSVVGDLVDVAIAHRAGAAGAKVRGLRLESRKLAPLEALVTRSYLRFTVFDRPGVLATITGALGDAGVSIEQMVQEGRGDGAPVTVVLMTHEAREDAVARALEVIGRHSFVAAPSRRLRVLG